MSEHAACKAGVAYDTFKGMPFDKRPCFEKKGIAPPGCDKALFPTAEERASRDAEDEKRMDNYGTARAAIVKHLGGPWKKGKPSVGDAITCPVCSGIATLRFSRAGYNGHIHAACQTQGCVAWME